MQHKMKIPWEIHFTKTDTERNKKNWIAHYITGEIIWIQILHTYQKQINYNNKIEFQMVLVNSTKHFRRNNIKHTEYFLQNGEGKNISQLILLGHNNSNYKFYKDIIF